MAIFTHRKMTDYKRITKNYGYRQFFFSSSLNEINDETEEISHHFPFIVEFYQFSFNLFACGCKFRLDNRHC